MELLLANTVEQVFVSASAVFGTYIGTTMKAIFIYPFALSLISIGLFFSSPCAGAAETSGSLCLDGFCIGQSINDQRFDGVAWITPKDLKRRACEGVACRPTVAFRAYPLEQQDKLADVLSWTFYVGFVPYNTVTSDNLTVLRSYKYECNPLPRGIFGERRFIGGYRSTPSRYLTVVGLRLIDGELRIYRLAREYPYHNQGELISLAGSLRQQYGSHVLFVDYHSSNAYAEVIERNLDGWFGSSSSFNVNDPADNRAELVLIDPRTRPLLEPSSMPTSGEIKSFSQRLPEQCSAPMRGDN
jgi:hypothetical protein